MIAIWMVCNLAHPARAQGVDDSGVPAKKRTELLEAQIDAQIAHVRQQSAEVDQLIEMLNQKVDRVAVPVGPVLPTVAPPSVPVPTPQPSPMPEVTPEMAVILPRHPQD